MPERLFVSRLFLSIGGGLIVLGLALWFLLPVAGIFPPYVSTGLLAVVYGGLCWGFARPTSAAKS